MVTLGCTKNEGSALMLLGKVTGQPKGTLGHRR